MYNQEELFMRKKLLCGAIILSLLFANALAAFPNVAITNLDGMERYAKITNLSSRLSISSNGYATCACTVTLRPGYNADVTVTLYEMLPSGLSYVDSWNYHGSGITGVNKSNGCYVDHGTYIVITSTYVTDSAGNYVESPSMQSNAVIY